MSDAPIAPRQPPSLLAFLATHKRGETVEALSRQLQELIANAEQLNQDHGMRKSKSSLTIKISVERNDGLYLIDISSSSKTPNEPSPREVYWATPDNGLIQQDPRQMNMPFRDVAAAPRTVSDVSSQ